MTHATEIVSCEKVGKAQFTITIRCCGNPDTDWRHTMAASVMADEQKRNESITWARMQAAKLHEDTTLAADALVEIKGQKSEVEI